MFSFIKTLLATLSAIVIIFLMFIGLTKAQSRNVSAHDPVMIQQDQTYYLFHTGRGISVKSSIDLINWTEEKSVFDLAPQWTFEVVPDFQNHMWAPDIAYHDDKYYLYYSVSSFGRNTSAIGVATNQTLDPGDPNFEWIDHGPVVESVPGRDMWNAIDPNVAIDEDGTPWLTFGSYWMGMKLVKLQDNLIEPAMDAKAEWHTIAARHRYWKLDDRDAGDSENGDIEAPFIFKKNGYYYLFSSWDRCCAGENSTYKVVVGRSKDITGPYLDRTDKDMRHGGGTLVIKGNESWAGIGHNSAYTFNDTDYFVAHGYDLSDEGRSKLIMLEIEWDEEGWPQVSLN